MVGFGDRLRSARLAAGLSQADVAGSRFSVSYISRLEAGLREPTRAVVRHCETRLALPRGTLLGQDWGAKPVAVRDQVVPTTELAGLASRATLSWVCGAFAAAAREARAGSVAAEAADRSETWWQLVVIEIEALTDLGEYSAAVDRAISLTQHPWVRSAAELEAQASILASRSLRLSEQCESARTLAYRALRLTADYPLGDPVRVRALVAAFAAGVTAGSLASELEDSILATDEAHVAGLAAWALGEAALSEGRIGDGFKWQDRASQFLSPAGRYRECGQLDRPVGGRHTEGGVEASHTGVLRSSQIQVPEHDFFSSDSTARV